MLRENLGSDTPVLQHSLSYKEAWPSGLCIGLVIPRSRVRVPLWSLAGFVLGRLEFKSSAMPVNSPNWLPPAGLGFLILLCYI